MEAKSECAEVRKTDSTSREKKKKKKKKLATEQLLSSGKMATDWRTQLTERGCNAAPPLQVATHALEPCLSTHSCHQCGARLLIALPRRAIFCDWLTAAPKIRSSARSAVSTPTPSPQESRHFPRACFPPVTFPTAEASRNVLEPGTIVTSVRGLIEISPNRPPHSHCHLRGGVLAVTLGSVQLRSCHQHTMRCAALLVQ